MSIKIDDYPAIKRHLNSYLPQLEKRQDKGDSVYNLRNCAYMEDFYKQKIVWGNLNLRASYAIAEPGTFINAPSPIIVPANKYLLATLNSKIADFYIRSLGVTRNGGYFEYKPMFIEKLPVPQLTENLQSEFITLTDAVLNAIKQNKNPYQLEEDIDNLVYKLYDLDEDEIMFLNEIH